MTYQKFSEIMTSIFEQWIWSRQLPISSNSLIVKLKKSPFLLGGTRSRFVSILKLFKPLWLSIESVNDKRNRVYVIGELLFYKVSRYLYNEGMIV